jgi:hypothetical protein
MLRVRVVSPAGLTDALLERLTAAAGVRNLVVLREAARRPEGDAVHFDLSDGAANPVFRELRALGLARQGSIAVERVDATLTARTEGSAPGPGVLRRETAPVWEMVDAIIRAGAAYAPSFYGLLIIAGLIGAVGILTNSQILIVGAMVVGPEYTAIIAVALGLSTRDRAPVLTDSPCCGGSSRRSRRRSCSGWRSGRRAAHRPSSWTVSGRSAISSTGRTCSRSSWPCWPASSAWCP